MRYDRLFRKLSDVPMHDAGRGEGVPTEKEGFCSLYSSSPSRSPGTIPLIFSYPSRFANHSGSSFISVPI